MTTPIHDKRVIVKAFWGGCDGYLIKPLRQADLEAYLGQRESLNVGSHKPIG